MKRKSSLSLGTYWDNRAIERVRRNYKDTMEFIRYVEDMFNRSQSKIEKDIIHRLEKIAQNNDLTLAEVKKRLNQNELRQFKMSLQEYIDKGSGVLDDKTIKELENASELYHISQLQAMELELKAEVKYLYAEYERRTGEVLKDMYSDSFYRSAYDLQNITGYKHITRLNPKKLDVIINKPWAPDQRSFSKRIWGNSEVVTNILHRELGLGISLGEHPGAIAKRLTDKIAVSKRAAYTLAHTESAYFSELATYDSYKKHGVKKYQILATLDNRTSLICQDMDQRIFDLKDKREGINYPPFHPNCRTTTVPYFEDLKGTKAARDSATGKTVRVDEDLKYKDWYREYVDKELEKSEKGYKESGALNDINDPWGIRREKHAKTYYTSVRNRSKKFEIIAVLRSIKQFEEVKRFSYKDIEKIYNHIFINEYELTNGKGRFYPDYYMAQSWQRIREGKSIRKCDIIMLIHERLEYDLMNIQKIKYNEAHDMADKKYNYKQALEEEGVL